MSTQPPTFASATAITPQTSHTYTASFPPEWCIGTVPHGGFISSCLQRVATAHFATTLRAQRQPHTLTLHVEFLRRTEVGPALFTVTDVKLGRRMSTIHVLLTQEVGGGRREEVVAYITQGNLQTEAGVGYSTGWALEPAAAGARPGRFPEGDEGWRLLSRPPFLDFRKATQRVRFMLPTRGQVVRSALDLWMGLESGERFTNETLGFVCDMFPQIIECHLEEDAGVDWRETGGEGQAARREMAKFWYPTVLLNLDVKKLLPEGGVQWLFLRVRSKMIQRGRYDLEVVIMDEEGDLVALSHHVCLVLDAGRNVAKRRRDVGGEAKEGEKDAKL